MTLGAELMKDYSETRCFINHSQTQYSLTLRPVHKQSYFKHMYSCNDFIVLVFIKTWHDMANQCRI